MGRTGAAVWTGIGAALGLGAGLAGGRLATMSMADQELRANLVLLSSVGGAAIGAATASAITTPKLLTA
jgi:hypothetical protein